MKYRIMVTAILALVLITACSKRQLTEGTGLAPQGETVYMKGGQFFRPEITLTPGISITWINDDTTTHTVTATGGQFASGNLPPGARFTLRLDSIGAYPYRCDYHPAMTGMVRIVIR